MLNCTSTRYFSWVYVHCTVHIFIVIMRSRRKPLHCTDCIFRAQEYILMKSEYLVEIKQFKVKYEEK